MPYYIRKGKPLWQYGASGGERKREKWSETPDLYVEV
jgi:hypothetical protein